MPTFDRTVAGIIELTPQRLALRMPVDDSGLSQLLDSFAQHEHLGDADEAATEAESSTHSAPRWSAHAGGSVFDARTTLTADLGQLLAELEREYAQIDR